MAQLDATFAALADPTRRAIIARLARGEATVKQLSEPFAISAPAISKHLKVLEQSGLITRGREAQFRPCRLETDALAELADWVAQVRALWADRFDRLDAYLQTLQAPTAKGPKHGKARKRR
jgi:DNA-binding transcriptional ArsR family regulator